MNQEQFQGQKLISAFLWTFQNFKKHPHQRTPDSYSSRCFSIEVRYTNLTCRHFSNYDGSNGLRHELPSMCTVIEQH